MMTSLRGESKFWQLRKRTLHHLQKLGHLRIVRSFVDANDQPDISMSWAAST